MYVELHVATLALICVGCVVASALVTFGMMIVALGGGSHSE